MIETTPIQNQNVAYTVIDGEGALIDPQDSSLFWLNPVATRIWELADGQQTTREIANILCQEFEVDYETAVRDTQQMIEAFTNKRLFVVTSEEQEHAG